MGNAEEEVIAQVMETPLYYWTTVISLCLTAVFFIGVILWLYRPGKGSKYEEYGHLPLNDKEDHGKEKGRARKKEKK